MSDDPTMYRPTPDWVKDFTPHPEILSNDREASKHCPTCGGLGIQIDRFGPLTLWACPVCEPERFEE